MSSESTEADKSELPGYEVKDRLFGVLILNLRGMSGNYEVLQMVAISLCH